MGKGLGRKCVRPPISVTFEDTVNFANVHQPACTLCGDCVSGCNVGAKNTMLVNYLPDAANHGAEIFTELKVSHVAKSRHGWAVHFRPPGSNRSANEGSGLRVHSDVVILAAGSVSSNEILLRSRQEGLALSDMLGERFTGNGDVVALGYNSNFRVDGVGVGDPPKNSNSDIGPCARD